jgi:lysophospholipase L1-like esterase
MNISYRHESIRLTGRWDTTDPHAAVATATGSYIEFAFEGRMAVVRFDVLTNAHPRLHLWISLDGGDMFSAPIDSHLRILAKDEGKHVCRIIYKGGTEQERRWYQPLTGKVSFIGVQTEKPIPIPADDRKIIEFVGDSITEGVLIDVDFYDSTTDAISPNDQNNRCYQDDVCATYAWQTAEKLDLRPVFMGYGAVGATRAGCGKVPAAPEAYPYNFDGSPITRELPDYILINHGANDRPKPVEVYLEKYAELLDVIRAMNPNATVIALSAFCGAFHEELGKMIAEYNEKNQCKVHFIDSDGWIPVSPLHPLRDGHTTVAKNLIPILREIIG